MWSAVRATSEAGWTGLGMGTGYARAEFGKPKTVIASAIDSSLESKAHGTKILPVFFFPFHSRRPSPLPFPPSPSPWSSSSIRSEPIRFGREVLTCPNHFARSKQGGLDFAALIRRQLVSRAVCFPRLCSGVGFMVFRGLGG